MKGMESEGICRVCSGEGVLLDLFGQKVSIADDVHRCLSIKVEKDDGLPSKICVKCVGLISDCGPFVENTLQLKADGSNNHKSDDSCYYCSSSNNHLFPIPDKSRQLTKESFDIEVPKDVSICHRCQFHLDTIDDLKKKACASVKNFVSRTLSSKEKMLPAKEETVQEVVGKLTKKFRMEKIIEKPSNSNAAVNFKEVKVELVDIALYLSGLPAGTVNLKDYFKRLDGSHPIDAVSKGVKKKPGRKTSVVQQVESPVRSRRSSLDEPSETVLSPKVDGRKRSREVDSESGSVTKKSRRGSEMEDTVKISPTPKVSKKTAKPKSKKISPAQDKKDQISLEVSDVITEEISVESATSESNIEGTGSSAKRSKRQTSVSKSDSSKLSDETGEIEKPGSSMTIPTSSKVIKKAEKIRKPSKSLTKEEVQPISVDCVSSTEGGEECSKENDGEKPSPSAPVEKERKAKRKRKSYSMLLSEDEDDPLPAIVRGRKVSEDKDFFGRAGRRGRLRPDPLHTDDDSGLDESTVSGNEQIDDQPSYLKDVDKLLEETPKSAFTPFICSVCHEGYVSTVKGKLHKLITHDPHSNLVLELKRCDDELKRLLAGQVNNGKNDANRVATESKIDFVNKGSALTEEENDSVNRTNSYTENDSNGLFINMKQTEKMSAGEVEDEPDELFGNSNPSKPESSEKAFDDLFGGSAENDSVKETTEKSPEDKLPSERVEETEDRKVEFFKRNKEADKDVEEAEQKDEEENAESTNTGREGGKEVANEGESKLVENEVENKRVENEEENKHVGNEEEDTVADNEEETIVAENEEEHKLKENEEENYVAEDEEVSKLVENEGENKLAENEEGNKLVENEEENKHTEIEEENKVADNEEENKVADNEKESKVVDNEEGNKVAENEEDNKLVENEGENVLVEKEEENKPAEDDVASRLVVKKGNTDTDEIIQEEKDSESKESLNCDEKSENQFKIEEKQENEGGAVVDVDSMPSERADVTEANVVDDSEEGSKFKGVTDILLPEDQDNEESELSENSSATPKALNSSCDGQLNTSAGNVNVFQRTSEPLCVNDV